MSFTVLLLITTPLVHFYLSELLNMVWLLIPAQSPVPVSPLPFNPAAICGSYATPDTTYRYFSLS